MGALLTSKPATSPPPLISHQSVTALRQDSAGSIPPLPSTPPVVGAGVPQLERIKSDHPRLSASEDSNSPKISAKPAPPGATVCKLCCFCGLTLLMKCHLVFNVFISILIVPRSLIGNIKVFV